MKNPKMKAVWHPQIHGADVVGMKGTYAGREIEIVRGALGWLWWAGGTTGTRPTLRGAQRASIAAIRKAMQARKSGYAREKEPLNIAVKEGYPLLFLGRFPTKRLDQFISAYSCNELIKRQSIHKNLISIGKVGRLNVHTRPLVTIAAILFSPRYAFS